MQQEEIKAKIIELMEQLPIVETGTFNVLLKAHDIRQEIIELYSSGVEVDDKQVYQLEKKKQVLEQMIELNKIISNEWKSLTSYEKDEFMAQGMGIKKIMQYRKKENATTEGQNNSGVLEGTGEDV